MQQGNILQLPQRNSKVVEKKCLKRWFAHSSDIDKCSLLKRKHKKIDNNYKEPISYDYLDSKHLMPVLTKYKDFFEHSLFLVWAQTVLSQTPERPLPLTGQLTLLNPFRIHLKCLPEIHTTYSTVMKQIQILVETLDTFDHVKLQSYVISLNDFSNLDFVTQFYGWKLSVHFSCNEPEQMLNLRSSSLSVMEFLRPLFQNIRKSGRNNQLKPICKEKEQTVCFEFSESNDYKISKNSAPKQALDIKIPSILVENNKKSWFLENKLTQHESMFSATSKEPDVPDFLAYACSKTTVFSNETLFLSKMDDECHKQSWTPLDVTLPLAKFNLDYEEISGTTERFLNVINLDHSVNYYMPITDEKNDIEDLTENHCAFNFLPEEKSSTLKKSSPAETSISLGEQNILSSTVNFVNKIHTLSNSDKAKNDNLFSEDLTVNMKNNHVTTFPEDSINKDKEEDQSFSDHYPVACSETTEHVVPEISHSQIYSVTESSMYEEECHHLKELDAKSKRVFDWTPNSLNIPASDQFSYPTIQQCSRPLRLGLSKKQKVKHLHKK